ncbi:hypothetical protein [Marinicella sp. W31]|uniref:hypothetical protein n=1 Tax=Marinicella sp. W31 TaxID=3023713 RepID=UPI003757618A
MEPGESKIIKDKQGRDTIIIFPDVWPALPIEAFHNGITVGKLSFKEIGSTVFLNEIYINEKFKSSGIAKELIKSTRNKSISFKVSKELVTNLAILGFIEHCISENWLPDSVLKE